MFTSYIRVYAQESTPTPGTNYLGDCPLYEPDSELELSFSYKTYCGHCLNNEPNYSIPTMPMGDLLNTPTPTGPTPTPSVVYDPYSNNTYPDTQTMHTAGIYDNENLLPDIENFDNTVYTF